MSKHLKRATVCDDPVPAPREQCARSMKLGWFNERDALAALASARERHGPDPRTGHMPTRAYDCPFCSGWHLTHRVEWTEQDDAAIA